MDGFLLVQEAIKVDEVWNVQPLFFSDPFPLPSWFADGRNAKIARCSMLEIFFSYLKNCMTKENKLLRF